MKKDKGDENSLWHSYQIIHFLKSIGELLVCVLNLSDIDLMITLVTKSCKLEPGTGPVSSVQTQLTWLTLTLLVPLLWRTATSACWYTRTGPVTETSWEPLSDWVCTLAHFLTIGIITNGILLKNYLKHVRSILR